MADANAESIQQKIQLARRDAEALKDRIKRKKDELADTTCESITRICTPELHSGRSMGVPDSLQIPLQCAMSRDNEQNSYHG